MKSIRLPPMKRSVIDSEEDKEQQEEIEIEEKPKKAFGNGKTMSLHNGKSDYYTGNKSKDLMVHVMQKGIEVDKPIKAKIHEQSIEWRKRQWPIVPSRFTWDYNGVAHQYVDVNDVAVLTWQKDHEDNCKKCGGKMTVDTRESRALGRRGVFTAIWGLDNTHIILLIVFAIGAMGMAGAFFWAYNDNTMHTAQLANAKAESTKLGNAIETYYNSTGIHIPIPVK